MTAAVASDALFVKRGHLSVEERTLKCLQETGPLGNQLKCSLSLQKLLSPLGFCSGTRLVHRTDTRGRRRAPARGLLLHHRPLSLSPKACSSHMSALTHVHRAPHAALVFISSVLFIRTRSRRGRKQLFTLFGLAKVGARAHPSGSWAVSASAAHRLIPLMQSKHVINGPSQPALFVVRQTLKSNVSTMGGRGILLALQKC